MWQWWIEVTSNIEMIHCHSNMLQAALFCSLYLHNLFLVSLRDRNDARKKRDVHVGPLYKEINLKFKLYKCAYKDCILPDPNSVPLVDARPGDAVFWSNPNSWPNDTVPESGDCVTIEEGMLFLTDLSF